MNLHTAILKGGGVQDEGSGVGVSGFGIRMMGSMCLPFVLHLVYQVVNACVFWSSCWDKLNLPWCLGFCCCLRCEEHGC